jgi:hypothetical protein
LADDEGEMKINQQPIPPQALADPNAVEMARIWIANRELVCTLKVGMYRESSKIPEEKAWGVILADLARHVSNALEEGYGGNAQASLDAIIESLNQEIGNPTSKARGKFHRQN